MRFGLRHKRVGPFRLNFREMASVRDGKGLLSSVSLDTGIFNFRLWSANGQRGLSSVDTPGLGSFRRNLSTTQQRERAARQKATADTGAPLSHAPLSHTPRG